MCGLVGAIGQNIGVNETVFHQLLVVDTIRGLDSTGVLAVFNDWSVKIKKEVGPVFDLIYREDYVEQITDNKKPIFAWMGHNRAATRGEVIVRNAHPFRHGNIILAHNGTLHGTYPLVEVHPNPFGTDSEAICHHLSHNSIAETWKKIRGAAALSWWDLSECSMNLITNGDRPLNFVLSEDKKNMYWASESWMLAGILNRHSVKRGEIQQFKPHDHHKFFWDHESKTIQVEATKLEPPFIASVVQHGSHGWKAGKNAEHSKHVSTPLTSATKSDKIPKKWDESKKQWFLWVEGKRHYLFAQETPPPPPATPKEEEKKLPEETKEQWDAQLYLLSNPFYEEDEEGIVEDFQKAEDKVMARQLMRDHPTCGYCGLFFDEKTILQGQHNEFFQTVICKDCIDDPSATELMYPAK